MTVTKAEVWVALNVHFCETCGCDTMPDDRTGSCFWCETKIAEPVLDAPEPTPTTEGCLQCGGALTGSQRRFCGKSCKNAHWIRTDVGRALVKRRNARRREVRKQATA